MQPVLDFRNTNTLWCSVLVETLVRCGVRTAVVSPGSRSAALTTALARHPAIEAIPVLDERSAAFFALGRAKASGGPVVLVCTSGTAGANYLPAVIEARESQTPLLVITADRPPEMRECASGQTIDQLKLFGSHVVFFHELAVPEAALERLRYLRQTVAHAVRRARLPWGGPVHLNAPFRDPLAPVEDATAQPLADRVDEAFFAHLGAPVAGTGPVRWEAPPTARGLIVAGPARPGDPAAYARSVGALARRLGWPVLADALSPLRHFPAEGAEVIAAYEAVLRDRETAAALTPEAVLVFEGWPTSKTLRAWVAGSRARVTLVAPADANRDGLHAATAWIEAEPAAWAGLAEGAASADAAYREAWREAGAVAAARLAAALDAEPALFEGKATWTLAQHLPAEATVVVASSMPVRDAEFFWPRNERRRRFHFNRGANGIDGTLSTALGVAHGDGPAVLLTGDLSFLHDGNGLLLRPRLRGSLTVVLVNNAGGGIFEHLPIARFEPPFEEFFATPQAVDLGALCRAHGVAHTVAAGWAELAAAVAELPPGLRVIEIRTDRKRDALRRRELLGQPW